MRLQRIAFVFLTLFATATLPVLSRSLGESQVLAQTVTGKKAEAERLFNPGIEQFQYSASSVVTKLEAERLLNQGIEQLNTSQFEAALGSWQKALVIYREIRDRQGEGKALGNLGTAYGSLGDYPTAIGFLQQHLKIAREIKDRLGEGAALGDLGGTYDSLGDYPKAIDFHQQSLKIAREIKDRLGESNALGNLGIAYYSLQDYPTAIDFHQQNLKIAREIKDRTGEGAALGNLGVAYHSLGDYPKAIDFHQQRLKIAREIKDQRGKSAALANLGLAYYSLGDYPKAIDFHQQSLKIAREIKNRRGEGQSLNLLGLAFYKQGNLALSESILIQGITVQESLRGKKLSDLDKISIADTQRGTYRTLQQVLIAEKKTDAALEIAERGRARAFVELLQAKLSPKSQEQALTPPNIEQIQQIAKIKNATLVQYSIIYDDFNIQGKQQPHESELYIWVVKPTGEISFRKTNLKPLWQQQNTTLEELVITTRRESIRVRGRDIFSGAIANKPQTPEHLQQLHKLLIEPIADQLPNNPNDRVIFIAQQSLFLVPFAALQDTNGKYLIEKHTILTAPSIQVLDLTHQQRQRVSGKGVLVVGNPTMPKITLKIGEPPTDLRQLDGAEREAKAIAPLLHTQAITGSAATKAAIIQKMLQARFIHLATHGLLDDVKGLGVPGAIALAPDGTGELNDGLLTSNEILDLKLNAELVVLSACDTGRGTITGDGVIGLSRSLISAGVPSVIVSLWSVPDGSTSELMTEFYKNLQQKPEKAAALRNAMLTTMKQHPHPQYWAAFTLIGESE